MASREEEKTKTHATTISHTSTTNGNTTTTTTTITTTITTHKTHTKNNKNNKNNKKHSNYSNSLIIKNNSNSDSNSNSNNIINYNKEMISTEPTNSNNNSKAIDLYFSAKYFEAFELLSNSIDGSNNYLQHFNYGCICNKLCKYSLACKHFNLSIKINNK
eukprot:80143_1